MYLMLQRQLSHFIGLSLTAAKFKPLISSMSGFAFSYITNMFILIISYDFRLSPAQLLYNHIHTENDNCQRQSHTATDGQSVNKCWRRTTSEAHDQILITVWQLWSCFRGAPSLTRGRVCLLYMLLAFAIAVFLGSESFGTRNHILLSQTWVFPFLRLLWLAGSQWRYSTPPPHGLTATDGNWITTCSIYDFGTDCIGNIISNISSIVALRVCCRRNLFIELLPSNVCLFWLPYLSS
jgi:hypothetical protein